MTQRASVKKEIAWGDRTHTVSLVGWERRPDLPLSQTWRKSQIECLPTLARLAREGRLTICSYNELKFEEWRGRRGMQGTFGDLFGDITISKVQPAVERSFFQQSTEIKRQVSKDTLVEFCQFLINTDPILWESVPRIWQILPEFSRINLVNLIKFKDLCGPLTKNHFADAFHLWTAEVNNLDFFLTIDKKFSNAVRQNRSLDFHCAPAAPELLVQAFGISQLDPMPIPQGGPRSYFE